jgi:hypothetical protein
MTPWCRAPGTIASRSARVCSCTATPAAMAFSLKPSSCVFLVPLASNSFFIESGRCASNAATACMPYAYSLLAVIRQLAVRDQDLDAPVETSASFSGIAGDRIVITVTADDQLPGTEPLLEQRIRNCTGPAL